MIIMLLSPAGAWAWAELGNRVDMGHGAPLVLSKNYHFSKHKFVNVEIG